MINELKKILESKKVEYIITELKESSYELFFVHNELQMNRAKDVHHYNVTVIVKHKGLKGSASFSIHPTMNKEEVLAQIEEGIYAAKFVNNQAFKLAKPEEIKVQIPDSNMVGKDYKELGLQIAEAILKADKKGGILNATEVFIYDRKQDVYNSNGVHYSKGNVSAMIEYITTQKGKKEEVELYNAKNICELNCAELTKEVEEALKNTKLRAKAVPMPNIEKIDVLFRVEEIKELMGFYLGQTNLSAIFTKSSFVKIGDAIQGDKIVGDKINLTIDPFLVTSSMSSPFDRDCFVNHKVVIVKDGIVKNLWGSRIIAQYLKAKSKVNNGNIVLGTGSLTPAYLKGHDYLEIIKMSGIQVDSQTGSFGGEIRLAVLHKDGKPIPVSGGSITGFLKDYQQDLLLSKTKVCEDNYKGPKNLLIKGIQILGK